MPFLVTKPAPDFTAIAVLEDNSFDEAFTLGIAGPVNQQDGIIDHQAKQDDESDHGQQVHLLPAGDDQVYHPK